MKRNLGTVLVLSALAAWTGLAQAQEGPSISVSGFGTGALTWTDTNDVEFARPNQANGVRKDARTGVDSNFGIQATVKINSALSFTGQGLVRKFAVDSYGAELAWGFAKYKVNDSLSVRAGRIGAPIYMISDFRNVGYAQTLIRPSVEVYRQVNLNSTDGVDLLYSHELGEGTLNLQLGTGRSSVDNAGGSIVEFHRVNMLSLSYEHGPYTLRFGRAQGNLSQVNVPAVDGLVKLLNANGFSDIARRMSLNDVDGSFTSVGFVADHGRWMLQGEFAKRKVETLAAPDTRSWYLLGAYRIDKFTPYVYYGDATQTSPRTISGMPTTGPAAALTAGVNSVIRVAQQSTTSLGLRWDFYKSAALKVQWDHVKPKDGAGAFLKAPAGWTGPANVYAAGIDFVF